MTDEHPWRKQHKVTLLKQHLKAWDKAHENAMSRGHMVRKEMDKLNTDIVLKNRDDAVSGIIGRRSL